jgi:hypothetical protein
MSIKMYYYLFILWLSPKVSNQVGRYGFLRKSAIKSAAMAFSESQQSSRPLWLSPKVSNQVGRSTSYDTDGAVRVSVWSMRNDARINNP